ncbi:MAG: hypothetical protein COU28_02225 [Candidatus Magasanikbacteria bacterium CG10_big_fil_rev_8_21_14_0_10_36_16]|uniref:Uncharacterized protein n=1 Tax=Candidatus Magasanikbacteria bacterium CG10_big_fil_rev_8_21_14_0_10_36_16 TaxID=1974645 RepID=A0A2H0TYK9_9BACT|nr:MAG: hypothetical protein COU28_02225 [Candidatus Magasanikbacteria bacterium CG10_big_fil_rev_8_21_14_0_10_36_16]
MPEREDIFQQMDRSKSSKENRSKVMEILRNEVVTFEEVEDLINKGFSQLVIVSLGEGSLDADPDMVSKICDRLKDADWLSIYTISVISGRYPEAFERQNIDKKRVLLNYINKAANLGYLDKYMFV